MISIKPKALADARVGSIIMLQPGFIRLRVVLGGSCRRCYYYRRPCARVACRGQDREDKLTVAFLEMDK
jgi:hypothetical protein